MKKNKDAQPPKPVDKAEKFMNRFINILRTHKHINKIRIESDIVNIEITRDKK